MDQILILFIFAFALFFRWKRQGQDKCRWTTNQKSQEEKEEKTQRGGEAQTSEDVPPLESNCLYWTALRPTGLFVSYFSLLILPSSAYLLPVSVQTPSTCLLS